MNEPHQRFHDWLTAGAEGEPPRDAAVHASVCAACRQSIAALDLLAIVNTGLAAMPAEPTGREHGPLVMVGRLLGATAILFSAAILGVGVSQLVGVSPGGGPVAQTSPTPEQSVLAETAAPPSSQPAPSSVAWAGDLDPSWHSWADARTTGGDTRPPPYRATDTDCDPDRHADSDGERHTPGDGGPYPDCDASAHRDPDGDLVAKPGANSGANSGPDSCA